MTDWLDEAIYGPGQSRPGMLKRFLSLIGVKGDFSTYLRSSVRETDNIGQKQGKTRDFNPQVAVNNFFSLVYAAAQMNANSVARTPLRLYGRVRKGKTANFPTVPINPRRKTYLMGRQALTPSSGVVTKIASFGEDFQEITEHPALDVLRGVNKWFNAYDMTVLRVLYLELTGNCYLYVRNGSVRGRSFPMELWPMPSQWVKVVPSRDPNEPIIQGYRYGPNDAEASDYAPDEVIRWNYPNPRNLYYGLGKVEAAWREICLRNSKSEHDQAVFDNGARPDYVVALKNVPTPELTRFQKDIEQRLRGTRNRGKFLTISSEGATVTPLTFTAEELGDQDRVIEAICNVFGVPVAKFMSNKAVAGGQANVSDAAYLRDTVLPICRMDEETLNADYLPRFQGADGDLVLAYDNPVPEDREAQRADDEMKLSRGLISIDQWRVENGYEPEGGNAGKLLIPNNLVPIDELNKQTDAEPAPDRKGNQKPVEGEPEDDEKVKVIKSLDEALKAIASQVATTREAFLMLSNKDATALEGILKELRTKPEEKKEPVTKAAGDLATMEQDESAELRKNNERQRLLLLALLAFWTQQEKDIINTIDPKNPQPLAVKPEWNSQLSNVLLGVMMSPSMEAAHATMDQMEVPADRMAQVNSIIHRDLQEIADDQAKLINESTIRRVNLALDRLKADAPDTLFNAAVGTIFNEDAMNIRGNNIADDAIFIAGENGKSAVGEAMNNPPEGTAEKVVTARWISQVDVATCNLCMRLNGRTVIAGTEFAPDVFIPCDDTHDRCRCMIEIGTWPVNYPESAVNPESN